MEGVVEHSKPAPPEPNAKPNAKGYVGIDTLKDQVRKKVLKNGFDFNIIVVGRSGLGKSTLVNTLFKTNLKSFQQQGSEAEEKKPLAMPKIPKTTEIRTTTHLIEEKGVTLRLTVTDTPGFGDQINNSDCWQPILDYINDQYEKYLNEEQKIKRRKYIPDSRVHCCLYFLEPTGHSLKALDIECMRLLDKCVNIVPIIAKADSLTVEERASFKKRIQKDLVANGIHVYPFHDISDEDTEEKLLSNKIKEMIPYAVVGSEVQYPLNGRNVYARKTNWGFIEVENRSHCEFADLRDMLIRTRMQDLADVTAFLHYENFRHDRLQSQRLNGQHIDINQLNESNI
ncbi:Septin-9 [Chamberlinius hualienensis]